MGALGRQHCSTEKRVLKGRCVFAGLYVLLGHRCPLPSWLYRQKAVCEREELSSFQSELDMGVEEIEHFEPVLGTHTHVLVDRATQKRGLGLNSNRKMQIEPEGGSCRWASLAA